MTRPPPISPLFPYTTLFRSRHRALRDQEAVRDPARAAREGGQAEDRDHPAAGRREPAAADPRLAWRRARRRHPGRSEEHTSELQSHVNLVCRLLLEKKKKKN